MEFLKHLNIEKLNIAKVGEKTLPDDIVERLSGKEKFVDNDTLISSGIYLVKDIKDMLEDEEDDTNETTKLRIEELYKKIKNFDYLLIVNE